MKKQKPGLPEICSEKSIVPPGMMLRKKRDYPILATISFNRTLPIFLREHSWGLQHVVLSPPPLGQLENAETFSRACHAFGDGSIPQIGIAPQKVDENIPKNGVEDLFRKSSPLRGLRGYQTPRRRREAKADLRHSEDFSEIQGDAPFGLPPPPGRLLF